ncbi:MAG: hypothetical protein J6N52_07450 [Clostridia bacterium]|nr:hypothetical protein [Clostridia bacterium]
MIRKKLTALILSVCLSAVYAVPCVSGAEKTSVASAELAYGLLNHLGIITSDASYELIKNNAVTRGDFSLYLARMLGMSVSEEEASQKLADIGVLRGYEDGSLRPEARIKTAEMAVAALRAIGFNTFPAAESADYTALARQEGILKGVNLSETASMSDCIVLLYNTLHANTVTYMRSGTAFEKREEKPLLEKVFGLKYFLGRVTANVYTGFDGEKTLKPEDIRIDGVLYNTAIEDAYIWLGYEIAAYCSEDDTVVYIAPDSDNDEVTIESGELDGFETGVLSYTPSGSRSKTLKLTPDVAVIKNSVLVETDYEGAFDFDFGTVTCLGSDGKYSVIIIESYENYTVSSIDISKKILYTETKKSNGSFAAINLDDADYVDIRMLPYGKPVNENTILPKDLLSLAISADRSVIRGYLCTETVSGRIEAVSEDGKAYITIDGTEYEADPAFYADKKPAPGDSGSFVLDAAGRIAAYSRSESGMTAGYVYFLSEDENDNIIRVKIFNTSRQHIFAELADRVRLDGVTRTAQEVKRALCTGAGAALKRQLVMYSLDKNGKITGIDLAAETKDSREKENTLYRQLSAGSYTWYYQVKSFNRKCILSNNTYYMRVPPENDPNPDDSLFGCQPFSAVTWYNTNGSRSILGLYKTNDDTPYTDILLVSNTEGTTLTNQTELTMVSSVNAAIGPDDTAVTAIHGYRRGNEVTAYVEDSVYRNDVETGDIIRFATDVRGYVGDYEIVYDRSEDKVMWKQGSTADEYTNNTSAVASGLRYVFGYVNDLYIAPYTTGLNSVIQVGKNPGETDDIYQIDTSSAATTRFIVYDESRKKDKVYMGHFDEITPWSSCHDISSVSRVFVHSRSGWIIAVMIYK